jgi:hypothetical protein
MSMSYDTILFTEILDSIPDIKFIREQNNNGINVKVYQNKNGKSVFIDTSEDDISRETGKGHLKELLLDDLISALFPE